ncbi:MAG: hypothetical protein IPM48_00810 [Saprospiraceae bacterium]|nr:hypothetical protein [Saprospiraceae bacterium]
MPRLTIDVVTDYRYLTEFAHIEAVLYDNESKQTYTSLSSSAADAAETGGHRMSEFPNLARKSYTLLVRLLDTHFRTVKGKRTIISLANDRVTRVSIRR